jgi:FixJ family two-component response regulator
MTIQQTRVSVVDDDPGVLRAIGRLLTAHGLKPDLFRSGKEFREHARHADFCCLVLDLDLGDISGVELSRELSSAGILPPVIFMTGNDNEAARQHALGLGCVTCLAKPFTAHALISAIEVALRNSPRRHICWCSESNG